MNKLKAGWFFIYHLFFFVLYYLYAMSTSSDSRGYYGRSFRDLEWFDWFSTSTPFVTFLTYPFSRYFDFTYEACMLVFSTFGAIGLLLLFGFVAEKLKSNVKVFGIDLIVLIMFLPNMHFWTVSIGKGSVIMLGLGLFCFALNNAKKRIFLLLLGGFVVYYIRPHILYAIIIAICVSLIFGKSEISKGVKYFLVFVSIGGIIYLFDNITQFAEIGADAKYDSIEDMISTKQSALYRKADSGVDISNYSIPAKVLTFWFRPLFFDAPGLLGLLVSFENLFYIYLFFKILRRNLLTIIWRADYLVRFSFFLFLIASVPLAELAGNLGIAIRQKSQVFFFFLIVVLYCMNYQKNQLENNEK